MNTKEFYEEKTDDFGMDILSDVPRFEMEEPEEASEKPRSGLVFPLTVLSCALLLSALVPALGSRLFAHTAAEITKINSEYYSAQWQLIKHYRREAEEKLQTKDAEILDIQRRLRDLELQRKDLQRIIDSGGETGDPEELKRQIERLLAEKDKIEENLGAVYEERRRLRTELVAKEKEVLTPTPTSQSEAAPDSRELEVFKARLSAAESERESLDMFYTRIFPFYSALTESIDRKDYEAFLENASAFDTFLVSLYQLGDDRVKRIVSHERPSLSAVRGLFAAWREQESKLDAAKGELEKAEAAGNKLSGDLLRLRREKENLDTLLANRENELAAALARIRYLQTERKPSSPEETAAPVRHVPEGAKLLGSLRVLAGSRMTIDSITGIEAPPGTPLVIARKQTDGFAEIIAEGFVLEAGMTGVTGRIEKLLRRGMVPQENDLIYLRSTGR